MQLLQTLKAFSMKRPHEEAFEGDLQAPHRVRRKTAPAEVQPRVVQLLQGVCRLVLAVCLVCAVRECRDR